MAHLGGSAQFVGYEGDGWQDKAVEARRGDDLKMYT